MNTSNINNPHSTINVVKKNHLIADDIIKNHSAIYVDNIKIPIRKLINRSKRIILSNVQLSLTTPQLKHLKIRNKNNISVNNTQGRFSTQQISTYN